MSLPEILALSLSTLQKQPHIALFAVEASILGKAVFKYAQKPIQKVGNVADFRPKVCNLT